MGEGVLPERIDQSPESIQPEGRLCALDDGANFEENTIREGLQLLHAQAGIPDACLQKLEFLPESPLLLGRKTEDVPFQGIVEEDSKLLYDHNL